MVDYTDQDDDEQKKPIGKPITPPNKVPMGGLTGKAIAPQVVVPPELQAPDVSTGEPPAQPQMPVSDVTGQGPIAPMTPKPQYHGLNRVLDTIAGATKIGSAIEAAGGLGTEGWRQKNADEQRQIEEAEQQRQANATTEETGARTQLDLARAEAALHPPEKPTSPSQAPKVTHLFTDNQGNEVGVFSDGTTQTLRPVQPKPETDKAVTLQLPDGKKAAGKVDRTGDLLLEDGTKAPDGTMLYQQPNYGQSVLPTKTIDMIGDDGIPHKYQWNDKTQSYDIPVKGISASGQYGHEAAQAGAVERASDGLIADINAKKSKVGNIQAILESAFLNTPLADKDQQELAAEIASFAALQPSMHGFRGTNALKEFESLLGGIPTSPDALISAIQGMRKTAGYINPNLNNNNQTPPTSKTPFGQWQEQHNKTK